MTELNKHEFELNAEVDDNMLASEQSTSDLNELLESMNMEDDSIAGILDSTSKTESENSIKISDLSINSDQSEVILPNDEIPAPTKKRSSRKKKDVQIEETPSDEDNVKTETDVSNDSTLETEVNEVISDDAQTAPPPVAKQIRKKQVSDPVLTIESRAEIETQEVAEETAWHEIRNAYRTRKILTGTLGGVEQTETGKTLVIVNYNDFRVIIPMKEMMINVNRSPSGQEYADLMLRMNKILGNMLGAEIDFIVKGIESKSRSVVASRKDAMLKKRQLFYLNTDSSGQQRIYEGRVVQARVIAVAEKVVRIEAFGVECSILARDLAWDWIGDAHERFSIGDQLLVRILKINRDEGVETISIKADAKSVLDNTSYENLKRCRIQGKYAGKVTDVHKGVVFIRLANGVNAIAHSCYDRKMPGKKDDVSFAVTKIDEEQGVAVGIITRIIKQNL